MLIRGVFMIDSIPNDQLNLLRDQCRNCNGTGVYKRVIYGRVYGSRCNICYGSGKINVPPIKKQGILDPGR